MLGTGLDQRLGRQNVVRFAEQNQNNGDVAAKRRQSLENAAAFSQNLDSVEGAKAKVASAQHTVGEHKNSRWYSFTYNYFKLTPGPTLGLVIPGITALITGGISIATHHQIGRLETQKEAADSQGDSSWQINRDLQEYQAGRNVALTFFLLSSSLFSFTGAYLTRKFRQMSQDVWQAAKHAKDLEKRLIRYEEPTDTVNKMLLDKLQHLLQQEAEGLSAHIREFYEREPDVRPAFDAVFGSRQKLPTTDILKSLFLYYAYQQYRSAPQTRKSKDIPRLDLVRQAYVLMKTGREAGELFKFVEPKAREFYGQQFSKVYGTFADHTQAQVDSWTAHLRSLFKKEVEADSHIAMAQDAMMAHGLSLHASGAKHQQLKGIIQQLREQKQKIHETLKQDDPNVLTNPVLLEELNVEFSNIVSRLNEVLEANAFDLKVQEAIASADTQSLSPVSVTRNESTST